MTEFTHAAARHVPQVRVPRYVAPPVTVTEVTGVISPEPIDDRVTPGHYQSLMLDTRTGVLSFHEGSQHLEPWDRSWQFLTDVPRETWNRWHPGTLFQWQGPHIWFEPVPRLLRWVIDSGVPGLPYLGTDAANALLRQVTPYAQVLLNELFDAGGELDWSTSSAHAGRDITRLCRRDARLDSDADADLVDYAKIVARFPQVYRPELTRLPLDELPGRCESLTRFLGCNEHWHPEIKGVFGAPSHDGTYVRLSVTGVRAWYRTAAMTAAAGAAVPDPSPGQAVVTPAPPAYGDRAEELLGVAAEKMREPSGQDAALLGIGYALLAVADQLADADDANNVASGPAGMRRSRRRAWWRRRPKASEPPALAGAFGISRKGELKP